MDARQDKAFLLHLPEIVLEKIFGYMSFDEVSRTRIVCRKFNEVNKQLLNSGFRSVEKFQAKCLREVKSQLPRRESERRNHPLYRHCDILTAIETRLSLLNMTFMKFVECKICCFIPGKVLDEIYQVLRFIQGNQNLPRPHEILTELRDISSMAMEHFEEKIVPSFKSASARYSLTKSLALPGSKSSCVKVSVIQTTRHSVPTISEHFREHRKSQAAMKKELIDLKNKMNEMQRKSSDQEKIMTEQTRILAEHTAKLLGQEKANNELRRKLLEYEQRNPEQISLKVAPDKITTIALESNARKIRKSADDNVVKSKPVEYTKFVRTTRSSKRKEIEESEQLPEKIQKEIDDNEKQREKRVVKRSRSDKGHLCK